MRFPWRRFELPIEPNPAFPPMASSRGAAVALKLVGLILLLAAFLKTYGLFGINSMGSHGLFASPWVQAGLIYLEFLLGIWFWCRGPLQIKWLTACTLLVGFTAINFQQGWEGQASCGCFGSVPANPWLVFGADLVMLAMLLWARPEFQRASLVNEGGAAAKCLIWNGAAIAALIAVILIRFGSVEQALAKLRGQEFLVSPQVVDLGSGASGERTTVEVRVENYSARPLTIHGGTSDCTMFSAQDLPTTVPARDACNVRVTVMFPQEPGRFTRTGKLIVGTDQLVALRFQVTGVSRGHDVVAANP